MSIFGKKLLHRLQSLRGVIILTVVTGVLLASLLSYVQQTSDLQQRRTAEIQLELHRLGTLLSLAMREPLWQLDVAQANSIMEAAFVNSDVFLIQVWDPEDRVFALRERAPIDITLTEQTTLPVQRNGMVIGKMLIKMTSASYLQQVAQVRDQFVRQFIEITLVALVVIMSLMHWRLVRPLDRLVGASKRIERGELDAPIHKDFPDEVGALADSLEATRMALLNLIAQLEQRNRALVESNELLEHRVAERTQSLSSALTTLELAQNEIIQAEKLASLGRVVAGVAHELNTPIGNALTVDSTLQAELLALQAEMEKGSLKKSSLTTFLQRLHDGFGLSVANLVRAAQLISDFKQVAVDQTSDQRRVFDLSEVSNEVLNMLQPSLRKTGCQIQRYLAADVKCDSYPGRYSQILTNLVMNATHHAYPAGQGGPIEVHTTAAGNDWVELRVVDHGAGMDETVSSRIFDPFFTTKMGCGGTGLGMNIVHSLATRILGGRINVQSTPGVGTTVSVSFPRVLIEGTETNTRKLAI